MLLPHILIGGGLQDQMFQSNLGPGFTERITGILLKWGENKPGCSLEVFMLQMIHQNQSFKMMFPFKRNIEKCKKSYIKLPMERSLLTGEIRMPRQFGMKYRHTLSSLILLKTWKLWDSEEKWKIMSFTISEDSNQSFQEDQQETRMETVLWNNSCSNKSTQTFRMLRP